ncbi:MAG: hypothetical protein HKN92_04725 [Chitinophagales bacterium]|nr:hypothetical protein [Chitinophagales bacterium]
MSPGSKIFYSRTLPILFGVFIVSVILRLPNLDRPLSKHHEFCTAIALRIVQIWDAEGIEKFGRNPVMNYPGAENKYINNYANTSGDMVDAEGNYYYVSHPPFAYYLPYYVFTVLNINPTVLSLQVLNMLLHFLSGLFIYMTVCLLSKTRVRGQVFAPALVAFLFYIFAPPTMWFQSNVYMADMLVHVIFIIGLYTALKMIIRERFSTFKYLFAFFLSIFLMVYTSWLGFFFTFALLIYGFVRLQDNTGFFIPIALAMLATSIAIVLIIYQYSSINGFDAYFREAAMRFGMRSSFSGASSVTGWISEKINQVVLLFFNYAVNYGHIILLIGVLIFQTFKKKMPKLEFSENGYRFIWLSSLPVILLHLVFLNYSGQDFSVLYASAFYAVLMGIMYDKMKAVFAKRSLQMWMAGILVLGVFMYYFVNRPGSESIKGFKYSHYREIAREMKSEIEGGEVLFVSGYKPDPQLITEMRRNIKQVKSEEEAIKFLKFRDLSDGILFNSEADGSIREIVRIKNE